MVLLVFLAYTVGGTMFRNARLDAWARSVHLSEIQQDAMWRLWITFKRRAIPDEDPLATLSREDLDYVLEVCGEGYRPARFGSARVLRLAQFQSLLGRGYSPDQAAVIVGMTINRVGRRDI
jgi:hypothetical protein